MKSIDWKKKLPELFEELKVESHFCSEKGKYVMSYRAGNHHARGQGLQSLVEVNQDEMERKRLKTLEHQVLSLI